ncbi:MAG: DUF3341 domain-containing protein [Chloroherpetonaceae bacterium]|nr:DUF3341 domain-containing protein [Chloroherpetonaceae bacterium]MDW8437781.1 DUF3341 domain-containing protein [Chloroherpetonaceae bacterium]
MNELASQSAEDLKKQAEATSAKAKEILIEEAAEGVVAEFDNPAALLEAAEKIRDAGYQRFEVYSPFPIHGMDDAMGLKRSPLGYIVFGFGSIGTMGALLLQWWTSAVDYPIVYSGKPYFALPAFVPITFELTVILSAFTAMVGMFALNRMPRFFHPMFYSENFCKKGSDDGFFAAIFAWDKKFDVREVKRFLQSIGGKNIEILHRPLNGEDSSK